jgi:hypothetical protein
MPCERKHIEELKRLAMQYADRRISKGRMLKTMHALCDSVLAACDQSPWRSMESAPQYEEVLLRSNGARVGIYTCPRKMMSHTEYEALLRQYPECADDEDWYGYTQDGPIILRDENCPTGWMPMPRGGS